MTTKISFADWVTELEKAGRTKLEVAEEIGTTVTSLYRYLANDRVPDRDTMRRILDRSEGRVDVACFYADPNKHPEDAGAQQAVEGTEAAA
jgi:transcriptional regulator with XRE-family HTH domain